MKIVTINGEFKSSIATRGAFRKAFFGFLLVTKSRTGKFTLFNLCNID